MNHPPVQTDQSIVALFADVDGTLVTKEKVLTARAIEAVKRLRERGVVLCITSGRPPRGLRIFVEPLELVQRRVMVRPDLAVIDERPLSTDIPPEVIKTSRALHDLGQSLWLDNITRDLLDHGTLKR